MRRSKVLLVVSPLVAALGILATASGAEQKQLAPSKAKIPLNKVPDMPPHKPEMDEIQALQEHVKVCEELYQRFVGDAAGAAEAEVRCSLHMAKANLHWAQEKWEECSEDAQSAVSAGKTLYEARLTWYYTNSDREGCAKVVDAHTKLTQARLTLARVRTKTAKAKPAAEALSPKP